MSILELIAKGLTNVQVAEELHISKYTVAQHVAKMLKRSGAINRTDLVSRSYAVGILQNSSMILGTLRGAAGRSARYRFASWVIHAADTIPGKGPAPNFRGLGLFSGDLTG